MTIHTYQGVAQDSALRLHPSELGDCSPTFLAQTRQLTLQSMQSKIRSTPRRGIISRRGSVSKASPHDKGKQGYGKSGPLAMRAYDHTASTISYLVGGTCIPFHLLLYPILLIDNRLLTLSLVCVATSARQPLPRRDNKPRIYRYLSSWQQ